MQCRFTISVMVSLMAIVPIAAQAALGDDQRGYLDISASGVAASGQSADGNEDADKSGEIFGAAVSYDAESGQKLYGLDLSSTYFAYSDSGRDNRWTNRVAGNFGYRIDSDVTVALLGDLVSAASTLESSNADQIHIRGRLTVQPGPHRFRLTGGWRWRDYQDKPGFSSDGPAIAADYRYRLRAGNYFSLRGQYENTDSNLVSRNYRRTSLTIGYDADLAKSLSMGIDLTYKSWDYPGRPVGLDTQHDHSWSPRLSLGWEFSKDWHGEIDGTFIWRKSNDPAYDETVKRVMITLRKRFRF